MASPVTKTGPALEHAAEDCEAVAKAITEVGAAAQRLMSGPLTMRALCLLIRDALPRGSKLELSQVQDVLEAAAAIGSRHVRKAVR